MSSQVFTSVEEFGAASSKLQQLGFKVNLEESELVYRVRFKARTAVLLAGHVWTDHLCFSLVCMLINAGSCSR